MSLGIFVGSRIAHLRKQRKWSQKKLARESGVDQATISRIENGKQHDLSLLTCLLLLRGLDVSVGAVLGDLLTSIERMDASVAHWKRVGLWPDGGKVETVPGIYRAADYRMAGRIPKQVFGLK